MKHFIVTGTFIQMIDTDTSETRMIQSEQHPRQYSAVLKQILAKNIEVAFDLIDDIKSEILDVAKIRNEVASNILSTKTKGRFTMEILKDNTKNLFYVDANQKQVKITGLFLNRVLEAFASDSDTAALDKFLDKVEANQYSDIAATDLFEFLAVNGHPLTTDGDFLAFKIVRDDLLDFHSQTVLHEVGSIIALDPSEVDFNRNQTCSRGLHFCSRDYLPQYGGFFGNKTDCALLILKISPGDVAAFPKDYRNAKGRAVQYQVLARMPNDSYHHIIEYLLSQSVVDVAKDVTDVKTTTTRVYRQLNDEAFEAMVADEVAVRVDAIVSSAGPTPSVVSGRWTVFAVNSGSGRRHCVANAVSRGKARELVNTYNEDFATDSVRYVLVDQDE